MAVRDGRTELAMGIVLCALALGCDPAPEQPHCVVGADCASGRCQSDGHCAPQRDAGLPPVDAPPGVDAYVPGVDAGLDAGDRCLPNADGVVQRSEAPFGPGLMARYITADGVAVNTAGTSTSGGRSWDFSASVPGDHDLDLVTTSLDGRWFADSFPGADYVTRLSDTNDLLGVFRVTASALQLMGVVSPDNGVGRTQLSYAPPVDVLIFPLQAGSHWTSDSMVTGVAQGLAVAYRETYDSQVDARGQVITPYAPFDALRVRTIVTRDLTFTRTVVRQFLFVAECFGTIVTIVSNDNEPSTEFTQASELRRLGF